MSSSGGGVERGGGDGGRGGGGDGGRPRRGASWRATGARPPIAAFRRERPAPYVLVGEAPNRAVENFPGIWLAPDRTGKGHSANRLARHLDLDRTAFLRTFDRTNLLTRWPGRVEAGRAGDRWPAAEAFDEVPRLAAQLVGRRAILLGRRVATAFGLGGLDFMRWRDLEVWTSGPGVRSGSSGSRESTYDPEVESPFPARFRVAVLPHPSGANRWWNRRGNVEVARTWLRGLLFDAFGPSMDPLVGEEEFLRTDPLWRAGGGEGRGAG